MARQEEPPPTKNSIRSPPRRHSQHRAALWWAGAKPRLCPPDGDPSSPYLPLLLCPPSTCCAESGRGRWGRGGLSVGVRLGWSWMVAARPRRLVAPDGAARGRSRSPPVPTQLLWPLSLLPRQGPQLRSAARNQSWRGKL